MSSAIRDSSLAHLDAALAATVLEEVRSVARERAKNLTLETNIRTIGLDSLEYLDLIGRIEAACQVRIPETEAVEVQSCRDLVESTARQQLLRPLYGQDLPPEYWQFDQTREYLQLQKSLSDAESAGESDPFFAVCDSVSSATIRMDGRELINFSGNNYLGMSGDPDVTAAAKEAIDQYGTSVSASRLVSGTRPLHVELEREIADFLRADDAITFTSGHSTNAAVIGHLMGRGDLILHDELVHNSILAGSRLSGATRRAFPHNDWQTLDGMLDEVRHEYRKVLVIIEGVYSMDGDYPDVPQFIEVKRRHKAFLYIDEAHSLGTMGKTGRGVGELFGIKCHDVDIWMGTLSKALGTCGGYIAGAASLVKYVKYTCPGVIYTVGLSPASAAAALTAIHKLRESNERVATLQARAQYFLSLARQRGFSTGKSSGTAIVPVILGNSLHALAASRMMHERGISVQPIVHPAVHEEGARLRFFLSAGHSSEQLRSAADALAEILSELDPRYAGSGG